MEQVELTLEELKNLDKTDLSIILFYARWAPSSNLIREELKKLLEEMVDLKVFEFDIELDTSYAASLGIKMAPTLMLFKDNELIKQTSSLKRAEEIKNWMLTIEEDENFKLQHQDK